MNTPIKTQKKEIRKRMLQQRDLMSMATKTLYDRYVCKTLWQFMEQRGCQTVHTYLPMGSEIDIFPFVEQCLAHKKTVISPQSLPQRSFKNLVLTSLQDLEPGIFGTVYPAGERVFEGSYDLVVVPGLACDGNRYRVGYGADYYDTFLADLNTSFKIGLFYPFQKMDQVPKEPHDVQLDEVLCDINFGDDASK